MRSESEVGEEQAFLPFDPPALPDPRAHQPAATRPSSRRRLSTKGQGTGTAGETPLRHRLTTDALASLGWPAGTELVLGPCRTPRRGQVIVARDGEHLRIGIFEVQMGRAALRTDHGSVWIGPHTEFLGAVTLASAPLAGL